MWGTGPALVYDRLCDVAKTPVSMRLPDELVEQIDAMADHRDLTRTGMAERTIEVALKARQKTCSQTHRQGARCGECGLLTVPDSTPDNL